MAEYRFYCLDLRGRIGFADWFQAENNDDAISIAHRLKPDATRCEIWQGNRLVAKLNGSGRFEIC